MTSSAQKGSKRARASAKGTPCVCAEQHVGCLQPGSEGAKQGVSAKVRSPATSSRKLDAVPPFFSARVLAKLRQRFSDHADLNVLHEYVLLLLVDYDDQYTERELRPFFGKGSAEFVAWLFDGFRSACAKMAMMDESDSSPRSRSRSPVRTTRSDPVATPPGSPVVVEGSDTEVNSDDAEAVESVRQARADREQQAIERNRAKLTSRKVTPPATGSPCCLPATPPPHSCWPPTPSPPTTPTTTTAAWQPVPEWPREQVRAIPPPPVWSPMPAWSPMPMPNYHTQAWNWSAAQRPPHPVAVPHTPAPPPGHWPVAPKPRMAAGDPEPYLVWSEATKRRKAGWYWTHPKGSRGPQPHSSARQGPRR